jgi:alginate O-acetyltransferase complex protein AlgI
MINFSDLIFIFRFLPVFLIAFYITPAKFKNLTLLLGSLMFYAVGDLKMFPVLLGAVIINYLFGMALRGSGKKLLLGFVLFLDAAMLAEFKILGQFVDQSLMPIGISFFTFKMISYQVDNFRGEFEKEPGFVEVAAYFCMFPQVVSGPIMRFSDYRENKLLLKREVDEEVDFFDLDEEEAKKKTDESGILEKIEDGLRFFTVGLGMKVLLADHLAMLWKDIGTIGYESISTPLAWLGAATYSLQLYFDFWGYSLMAAGIGVMLGFPFVINFDHPYASKSVAEFYRRWHVSLGNWFRDYIYFPMGGSRHGNLRTIINLLVVWIITGFWHGVTFNFVLWGVILFAIIVAERFFVFKKLPSYLGSLIGRINVLVLIPLTWVVFAIPDRVMLEDYFLRLFPIYGQGISVNQGDFIKNLEIYAVVLIPGLLLLIPGIFRFFEKNRKRPVFTVLLLVLFWACIFSLSNAAGNPFMYFRF